MTSTKAQYDALVADCDALIKSGNIPAVSARLAGLNLGKIPRAFRQSLAKICRRAGLIALGLRLLHPIVRSENKLTEEPTPGEICEYAVLLSRNGSVDEALNLLQTIESATLPEADLYRGFCYISKWDYTSAIPWLVSFRERTPDAYANLIALVNLASAKLVTEEFLEARALATEALERAEKAGAARLVGNCLEIKAQTYLQLGDFDGAAENLERAAAIFGSKESYDQLLIYKWQSIMTAAKDGSLEPLERFRREAVRRNHWESVRDVDFFSIKASFDQQRFDHLVYGTSHEAYRTRILKTLRRSPSPYFLFGDAGGLSLDLATGKFEGQSAASEIFPGRKVHQVLNALVRDFYVPRDIGSLFAELYPDEYFNAESSPERVRQLLSRARRWMEAHSLPARIDQESGKYRLVMTGPFSLKIPLERGKITPEATKLAILASAFPKGTPFTLQDARRKLGLSRSDFHRLMRQASAEGRLLVEGANRATRYKLVG